MEMFHAKHKTDTKETILTSFTKADGSIRVLFSTIAFGMGIQIPDIDTVVHYGLPENILILAGNDRVGISIIYHFQISVSKLNVSMIIWKK